MLITHSRVIRQADDFGGQRVAASLSASASAVSTSAVAKGTASVSGVDSVFIKVPRSAAKPCDKAIRLYFALNLSVAALSAHETGVAGTEIGGLIRLEPMTQTATRSASVAICDDQQDHRKNAT